jgi:hypothetical protein
MSGHIPRQVLEDGLRRLGRQALRDRLHALRALADVRGMRYVADDGRERIIELALKPWVLTSEQLLFFHHVVQGLSGALSRLARLYAALPSVREVIRLGPEQEAWLGLGAHPRSRPLAVIGRLDSTAIYDHERWRETFRMLEPNAVGVGGVHYAPTGCSIILDVLRDVLAQALPGRVITPTPDPRRLLLEELRAVARKLHRPLRGVALLENGDFTTGTDEFHALAGYLRRGGVQAVVADPRELRLARGELTARGLAVDLLYRDSELSEFIEMERAGRRLAALRQAVRQGRLISGLRWEMDQKSAWEIFTDARYAHAFPPAQRRLFREHLLWTRLVRDARVSDPTGRLVELPRYILRRQAHLVLKPNALFGGTGVTLGARVSRRAWEARLHLALEGPDRYVVQQLAGIPSDTFPRFEDGAVRWQSRCVVSGFFFSSSGIGLVGRFCADPVVNVSRGGGLIAALWAHE